MKAYKHYQMKIFEYDYLWYHLNLLLVLQLFEIYQLFQIIINHKCQYSPSNKSNKGRRNENLEMHFRSCFKLRGSKKKFVFGRWGICLSTQHLFCDKWTFIDYQMSLDHVKCFFDHRNVLNET